MLNVPADGHGDSYYLVSKMLSEWYAVITCDRHVDTRSTMHFPNDFDMWQQSRAVLAVLKAAGEERAIVFGNSSDAVIAHDFATGIGIDSFTDLSPISSV